MYTATITQDYVVTDVDTTFTAAVPETTTSSTTAGCTLLTFAPLTTDLRSFQAEYYDYLPDALKHHTTLAKGSIAGIAVGSFVALLLVVTAGILLRRRKKKHQELKAYSSGYNGSFSVDRKHEYVPPTYESTTEYEKQAYHPHKMDVVYEEPDSWDAIYSSGLTANSAAAKRQPSRYETLSSDVTAFRNSMTERKVRPAPPRPRKNFNASGEVADTLSSVTFQDGQIKSRQRDTDVSYDDDDIDTDDLSSTSASLR